MAIVGRPLPGSNTTSTTTSTTSTTTSTSTTSTTLVGDPSTTTTTTAPPAPCSVVSLTTTPASVPKSGNQLQKAVAIDFTTNGSLTCSDLRVQVLGNKNNPGAVEHGCGCGIGPSDFTWSYSGSDNIWQKGSGTVQVLNGTQVLATTTFTVT